MGIEECARTAVSARWSAAALASEPPSQVLRGSAPTRLGGSRVEAKQTRAAEGDVAEVCEVPIRGGARPPSTASHVGEIRFLASDPQSYGLE
jgi:hypothetical protein